MGIPRATALIKQSIGVVEMNGFDILDAQIKAMLTDLRSLWNVWVWDIPLCRWATYIVVLLPSLIYGLLAIGWLVFSVWYRAALAMSVGGIVALGLQLIGIAGVSGFFALWSIKGIVREIKKRRK